MSKQTHLKILLISVMSFTIGAFSVVVFADNKKANGMETEIILQPGVFGKITAIKAKSEKYKDSGETLLFFLDEDYPFLGIRKDNENKIIEVIINDGRNYTDLIHIDLEKDKLSEVYVNNMKKKATFRVSKNEEGKWSKAVYYKGEKGKLHGDTYCDLDFDGVFDLKQVFHYSEVQSEFIFLNGQWYSVDVASHEKALKIDTGKNKKILYVFEEGTGWKEAESKPIKAER